VNSDFLLAIRQIEREREIPPDEIQAIIEDALVKAFQQESEGLQSIRVEFDMQTGRLNIFRVREAIEEVTNPVLEISLEDALRVNDEAVPGDLVETPISLRTFRRIGIQAVKQHIALRVRDMEKTIQLDRFADKEGQIITGAVSRITSNGVIVNLDRIDGIMPNSERIPGEKYAIGRRIKVYVLEVRRGGREGEIVLSRSHPEFVQRLFHLEVPEIAQNIVQIKNVVREAGYRTKMAVLSTQDKVDPVGACVGYKGSRVKNIVNELNGEKIDIIPWDDDPAQYIAHALSPAQVISVEIFDEEHGAEVIVPDNQLSLAIGKQGQNARLANKLTGWKIDILSDIEKERLAQELRASEVLGKPVEDIKLTTRTANLLSQTGIATVYDLICKTEAEVSEIQGLGEKSLAEIKDKLEALGLHLLADGEKPPAPPRGDKEVAESSEDQPDGAEETVQEEAAAVEPEPEPEPEQEQEQEQEKQ
jgi:transcription termination/antitermination protein NusA